MAYFHRRSIVLIKTEPFDQQRRDQGLDWPLFGYTMTGRKRLDNLQYCVEDILARAVPEILWKQECGAVAR
jgi:O-methyltransferase